MVHRVLHNARSMTGFQPTVAIMLPSYSNFHSTCCFAQDFKVPWTFEVQNSSRGMESNLWLEAQQIVSLKVYISLCEACVVALLDPTPIFWKVFGKVCASKSCVSYTVR